jgi:hypothetical protein
VDEPQPARVLFDWDQISIESQSRRVELRRQQWNIRRRELELIASKNFLLPRFDAVGRYRWRGFGDDLLRTQGGDLPRFDNAYEDLTTGDFQEWQLGMELTIPIGYRRAHTAVRNAELRLARERALLEDQRRHVLHEVADAIADLDRAYAVSETAYNRLIASREQLAAVQAAYDNDKAPLDLLLDAQRRVAEGESRYYGTLAEYAVAAKNLHFVKGTLLEYDGVYLAEGAWPQKAYHDAAEREARRGPPRPLNYVTSRTPIVSRGTYPQLRSENLDAGTHGLPYVEIIDAKPDGSLPAGPSGQGIDRPAVSPPSVEPTGATRLPQLDIEARNSPPRGTIAAAFGDITSAAHTTDGMSTPAQPELTDEPSTYTVLRPAPPGSETYFR